MLTLWKERRSYCGGLSRRGFLQAGALGLCGLTAADLLRLRAHGGIDPARSGKAVIMVCLSGGPSHIDTYDLKPDAPAEYRGPFKPIKTNVPGFEICELFPRQATCADRLALIRGVKFSADFGHKLHEVYTGFPPEAQRPAFGSVVSRLRADRAASLPRYVSLRNDYTGREVVAAESPAYLGVAHQPFTTRGLQVPNLTLPPGTTPRRLADRTALLRAFDTLRRDLETRQELSGADAFTARALDMVGSPRVRDAFDISREPGRVRQRYGPVARYKDPTSTGLLWWDPAPFLQARRLVEAGVPVVTLDAGSWDHHGADSASNIFESLRTLLPLLDHAIHGLVTDLDQRGLANEVAVVIWGEMGRTPRISERRPGHPGRDHWPEAGFALVAGGGLRMGQVIGSTDAHAGRARGKPCTPQNVLATVYHVLGIDAKATLPDHSGRPLYLLDDPEKIEALL